MGSNALEELRINEILDTFQEIYVKHLARIFFSPEEKYVSMSVFIQIYNQEIKWTSVVSSNYLEPENLHSMTE